MSEYSPFENSLNNMAVGDLKALLDVAEGWYIEYKRETPSASSIAKSISAFANTYGGWLFYGIEEKSKEEPVAGKFHGISKDKLESSIHKIRQAVAANIDPAPHYDTKVFWGPCDEIDLASDQAIICVKVPRSFATPHVHRSGHIYRRIGDGSEPKPESDRFILDQLWHRADSIQKQCRDWIEKDPEFSKAEGDCPYVRLILPTNLWRETTEYTSISLDEFRTIMEQSHGVVTSMPFDTVYPSTNGYVARQIKGNDPHRFCLTWKFSYDLSSEVIIPMTFMNANKFDDLEKFLSGYEWSSKFLYILKECNYHSPKIVDLNILFSIITAIVEIKRNLLKKCSWKNGYFAKSRILNVWRFMPFLDLYSAIHSFEYNGVPMCLEEVQTCPNGYDISTFIKILELYDVNDERDQIIIQTFKIFIPIARGFGLSIPDLVVNDNFQKMMEELQGAANRAIEVQKLRNKNSHH